MALDQNQHQNPVHIQQAALNTDPAVLTSAVKQALETIPLTEQDLFAQDDLLTTLDEISPEYQLQAEHQHALEQQIEKLISAARSQAAQQQTNDTQNIRQALAKLRTEEEVAAQRAQEQHHQMRLNANRKAAVDEANFVVDKAIAARRDKAFYDSQVLGALCENLLYMNVIVPVDEQYYALGFKFNPPQTDEYLQYIRDMHNDAEILTAPPSGALKV